MEPLIYHQKLLAGVHMEQSAISSKRERRQGGIRMKKVAIIRCLDVSMRCVGASCMKSFNNRTVKFERYGDEKLELFAGLTCNGCGKTVENDEGLKKKLDRLAEEPVDVVHFSSCTNKKDKENPKLKKRCPWVEKMKDYLESKGVEVVYGTHH